MTGGIPATGPTTGPAPGPAIEPSTRLAAVFVSAGVAGNQLASYLLNVLAARLLVPAAFGELGSLLAVLVIGAVPAMGLQTVTALRVARDRAGAGGAREMVALGLTTAGVVTAVALLAVPLLMPLLHLTSPAPAVLLALALTGITVTGLCYGLLQGRRRFRAMSALLLTDALVRVGGTLAGLAVTRTATGALAGAAAGAAVVAVTGWVLAGRPRPRRRGTGHGTGHVRDVLHAVSAMLALVLLVNLDLVLARHHLPADEAGEYAVGAIVAKIAYWLPQAVAILVLPRLASERGRRRALPVALAVCVALDLVVVAGAVVMAPTVVAAVGGADYAGSAFPVWPFALVGSLLSVVQILLYSRIARNDRWSTLLIWLAVAAEVVLVTTWLHGGLTEVVTAAVAATGLLVCAGAAVELRSRREPLEAAGDDGGRGE